MLTAIRPRHTRPITGTPLTAAMVSAFATANAPTLNVIGGGGTWPDTLPDAARQIPSWVTQTAAMRALAVGGLTSCAATGAPMRLLSRNGGHEYSSGYRVWSHPFVVGASERCTVGYVNGGAGTLVDVDVATLATFNPRVMSGLSEGQMNYYWSPNPATPRILYYIKNANGGLFNIAKVDTATMLEVVGGGFPKNLKPQVDAILSPQTVGSLQRLMISDDELIFAAFANPSGSNYHAVRWDKSADTVDVVKGADAVAITPGTTMNELAVAQDGSTMFYVADQQTPANHMFKRFPGGSLTPSTARFDHQDTMGNLLIMGGAGHKTFDPATNVLSTRYGPTEVADLNAHPSCQYQQLSTPVLDRWIPRAPYTAGQPFNNSNPIPVWSYISGTVGSTAIYKADIQWVSGTGQTNTRFDTGGYVIIAFAVDQYIPEYLLSASNGKVTALGNIVADNQYYWDNANGDIYFRPPNGLLLLTTHANHVTIYNPPAVVDGFCFVKNGGAAATGGKKVKLWHHSYSWLMWDTALGLYGQIPKEQISQCGRLAIFNTNEGNRNPTRAPAVYVVGKPPGT